MLKQEKSMKVIKMLPISFLTLYKQTCPCCVKPCALHKALQLTTQSSTKEAATGEAIQKSTYPI